MRIGDLSAWSRMTPLLRFPSLVIVCVVSGLTGSSTIIAQPIESEVEAAEEFSQIAAPFFEQYCIRCHGPEDENGGLRVDRLGASDFDSAARSSRWKEILSAVNGYQMPPEDERQPTADDAGVFADWVLSQLAAGEIRRQAPMHALRRLNRREYGNTIRDLVGDHFRVHESFPEDASANGFDNNGSVLTVSPLHLELYVDAARTVLDQAIVEQRRQPKAIQWRFEPEENTLGMDRLRVRRDGQEVLLNSGDNRIDGDWTRVRINQWDKIIEIREFRLPYPGIYKIRFHAFGEVPAREDVVSYVAETTGQGSRGVLEHFQTDRMYDYGPPRVRVVKSVDGSPETIQELDIPATQADADIYEVESYFSTDNAGIQIQYAYEIPLVAENWSIQDEDGFPRPAFALDWIEVEGPIYSSWPPATHTSILPDYDSRNQEEPEYVRAVLTDFMSRAYRRPVAAEEVESRYRLYEAERDSGESLESALKAALTAVLSSPKFLYLVEGDGSSAGRALTDYELASRLSYFLWSSMPDAELFDLAASKELSDPSVLQAQADRMLTDARSEEFVRNFAGQWLRLREIGNNAPSISLYPRYDRHLELSIARETESFFAEILHNDLDIANFIRSDFVTVNERLARFYGIPDVHGDSFRRVQVPEGVPRGGLVTQASIHSITSNGTRTSPVERGVWILQALLDQDPGLPVTNVGEIPPIIPGLDKATVRQRLAMHRERPQCARCHNKIDPLGLALENFDASGAWRDREAFGFRGSIMENDPWIDASARMPDGREIDGVAGLQGALLDQKQAFFAALTRKLLIYSLGRSLGYADEQIVQQIVNGLDSERPTLRYIIHEIISTEAFRSR